jgi:hypothetical protein
VTFEVEGRLLCALGPEQLVILLACHCSELDASRLLRVYELVLAVRAGVDWSRVLSLLAETGAARFTWPAFVLAESLAPGTVDARVLDMGERESTWAARHTVSRLVPAGGRIGDLGLLRHLMWTRGTVAVVERVRKFLWPAPSTAPARPTIGWRTRLHQWQRGRLTISAPDERPPR